MGCGGSTARPAGASGPQRKPAKGKQARGDRSDFSSIVPDTHQKRKRAGDGPKRKGKKPGTKKGKGKAKADRKQKERRLSKEDRAAAVEDVPVDKLLAPAYQHRDDPSTPHCEEKPAINLDMNGKVEDDASSSRSSKLQPKLSSAKVKKKKKEQEAGLTGQKLLKVEEWMDEILWENLMDPDEQVAMEQNQQEDAGVQKRPPERATASPPVKRQSLCGAALKNFATNDGGTDSASAANTSLRLRQSNTNSHQDAASTASFTPSTVNAAHQLAQTRGPRRSQVDIAKLL